MIPVAGKKRKAATVDEETPQTTDVEASDRAVAEASDSPDASKLPLARLSNNFVEDGYTDFLLIFARDYK